MASSESGKGLVVQQSARLRHKVKAALRSGLHFTDFLSAHCKSYKLALKSDIALA
jgi:hypothetical protein